MKRLFPLILLLAACHRDYPLATKPLIDTAAVRMTRDWKQYRADMDSSRKYARLMYRPEDFTSVYRKMHLDTVLEKDSIKLGLK